MLETSARLLRLLSLFQGRRYWSGAGLASRLEVTSRTLRRDVDKLRTLGYPIHSTAGLEGGYQLGAGSTMPPLLLDDDEAVAVALGLRYAASGSLEGVEEASVRALAKIEQILPARLARRVGSVAGCDCDAAANGIDSERAHSVDHSGRLSRSRILAVSIFRPRRRGECQVGRAASAGEYRAPVVSGRMGHRPERLANIPCGPDSG